MMSEYELLAENLKKILKKKKWTYTAIAEQIDVSETSVKRLLNGTDGSIQKIAQICKLCDISFTELVDLSFKQNEKRFYLPTDTDEFFASYFNYFSFFILIYRFQWSIEQIQTTFNLTDASISKYLKKLEELKIIERHDCNKFKFLVEGNLHTTPQNGPLFNVWRQQTANNFIEHVIKSSQDRQRYCLKDYTGQLTEQNYLNFISKLSDLSQEFLKQSHQDSLMNDKKKLVPVSLQIACGEYQQKLSDIYPVTNI